MAFIIFHRRCYSNASDSWWSKLNNFILLNFFKSPFNHCYIASPVGNGDWVVISGSPWGVDITVENAIWWNGIETMNVPKVWCETIKPDGVWRPRFGVFTCVSLCKHYLGVWEPFIWSPKQLYNFLDGKKGR